MATVHVVLSVVQRRALTGATMPVPDSVPAFAETLTSTGTSAQGAIQGSPGQFWSVTAQGGKIWVAFGASPTAAVAAAGQGGWLVLDGQTRDFAVSAAAEKYAIKDA